MVGDSRVLDPAHIWHVTLTVTGAPVGEPEIRTALERLSHEHPFLLAGRFGSDRAEVRYWEEAVDMTAALTLAVQLWEEHRGSAQLPQWQPAGIEVISQDTFHRRGRLHNEQPGTLTAGRLLPF
ncbi:MAG: hypothetical protein EXQ60_02775 [Candidatus Nanopelagicales bacterium]|nr:hypothetical protein [Candidatus Nanopelagicales bacterium]